MKYENSSISSKTDDKYTSVYSDLKNMCMYDEKLDRRIRDAVSKELQLI